MQKRTATCDQQLSPQFAAQNCISGSFPKGELCRDYDACAFLDWTLRSRQRPKLRFICRFLSPVLVLVHPSIPVHQLPTLVTYLTFSLYFGLMLHETSSRQTTADLPPSLRSKAASPVHPTLSLCFKAPFPFSQNPDFLTLVLNSSTTSTATGYNLKQRRNTSYLN